MDRDCTCPPSPCPACIAHYQAHGKPGNLGGRGRPAHGTQCILGQHHDDVVRAAQAGEPYPTIAERYGVSRRSVTKYLERRGLIVYRLGPRKGQAKPKPTTRPRSS